MNSLINPVKALKDLDTSTNFGFNGIRTNQYQTQGNTYLRWRLNHRNRYLHIGARMINEGILRIYLDDQLIETETKATATTEDFVYLYDMTTIASGLGITALILERITKLNLDIVITYGFAVHSLLILFGSYQHHELCTD